MNSCCLPSKLLSKHITKLSSSVFQCTLSRRRQPYQESSVAMGIRFESWIQTHLQALLSQFWVPAPPFSQVLNLAAAPKELLMTAYCKFCPFEFCARWFVNSTLSLFHQSPHRCCASLCPEASCICFELCVVKNLLFLFLSDDLSSAASLALQQKLRAYRDQEILRVQKLILACPVSRAGTTSASLSPISVSCEYSSTFKNKLAPMNEICCRIFVLIF